MSVTWRLGLCRLTKLGSWSAQQLLLECDSLGSSQTSLGQVHIGSELSLWVYGQAYLRISACQHRRLGPYATLMVGLSCSDCFREVTRGGSRVGYGQGSDVGSLRVRIDFLVCATLMVGHSCSDSFGEVTRGGSRVGYGQGSDVGSLRVRIGFLVCATLMVDHSYSDSFGQVTRGSSRVGYGQGSDVGSLRVRIGGLVYATLMVGYSYADSVGVVTRVTNAGLVGRSSLVPAYGLLPINLWNGI
ncbi:hypothetical protein P692DRAFT_201803555 [Suillus brevipes Sb2]|nr:hypothetical protein P692DRAFT_201803555 [Suillus brevipes Sb2]